MNEIEKLLRDIHTLRESIQIDWDELYSNPLREEERREIGYSFRAMPNRAKVPH